MWISKKVWALLEGELAQKNKDLQKAYERVDRLTEALARKEHVTLSMPQAPAQTLPLERSQGWYDNKPAISIPSGEKK